MGNVDPTIAIGVIVVLMALGTFVMSIVRTIHTLKQKPPHGETLATIGAKLQALDRDLEETKARHTAFESKMTTQIGDLWTKIDLLISIVSENGGTMKLFIDEMRNWRNNHDAKANHP